MLSKGRKFFSFMLTLSIYTGLLIFMIIKAENVGPLDSFALNVAIGLTTISGAYYAGNVADSKKDGK